MRKTKSTNPELLQLISFLKKQARETQANIWLDVAEHLAKPSRQRTAVNLSRINRHTEKREVIVVPGKVLGAGSLNHPVTVAAFGASEKAKQKLASAKANFLSIPELVKENPKGSNVKIIR
ncbi:MAG: 50S ribosomal protein L18e [Candidatus Bathyarchaeota archaeon]|nr:50S ribosomal protein L18e [Candidatus Bathyarchaeota archaeon]